MGLFDWRIISRVQVDGVDFFDERAILLGGLFHRLPLRVGLKILPTLCRCFLARESQEINELLFCLLRIGWLPKPDDRHVVFLEELQRVVTEASVQFVNLARFGSVGPQFENSRVHFFISFGWVKGQAGKGKAQCYDRSHWGLHHASSSPDADS